MRTVNLQYEKNVFFFVVVDLLLVNCRLA